MSRVVQFTVEQEHGGSRLDKLVVRHVAGLGRRRAAELFARGDVTIDGAQASKGQIAAAGASISVTLEDSPVPPEPDAPLTVLLERADIVVIDKPPGQPCAPLRGESGTVASALIARYPEMALVGYTPREPGLLHRLDNYTSGALLAARSPGAFEALRRGLVAGGLDKRYLAVVEHDGVPDEGVINASVGPDPDGTPTVQVYANNPPRTARRAETRFRVVKRGLRTLLEVRVSRAYRHQIRAHLAHAGFPIVGDLLYGGPSVSDPGQRHALHASHIAWAGDATVAAFTVEAALPEDLVSLIDG